MPQGSTFRNWIRTSSWGKALMIVLSIFLAPLVVFAYAYERGAKLEHWIWWVLIDVVLYLYGIGGFSPLLQGAEALWNGSFWLQISIQAIVPYALAVLLAWFMIYHSEHTGSSRQSGGGGMASADPYGDGRDSMMSLSKGAQRHLEKVSKARAQAARQMKRDVAQGEV
ncbi:uncharacterized protein JCM6883_002501 [Sporobolomyces salmoneus]|uniref:uncharacterized protein n=1 Tax=Sporobolomyces salmoneus TaxID=183962 RepID=UPI003172A031